MGEVKKLGGVDEILIFFRDGHFYPIQGVKGVPLWKQAADHARINPGIRRVEDIDGNVLWPLA